MSKRNEISDEELENVNGGFFNWDYPNQKLTYFHEDGTVTTYDVLDFENGWTDSNNYHGQNIREDEIIQKLIRDGRIRA